MSDKVYMAIAVNRKCIYTYCIINGDVDIDGTVNGFAALCALIGKFSVPKKNIIIDDFDDPGKSEILGATRCSGWLNQPKFSYLDDIFFVNYEQGNGSEMARAARQYRDFIGENDAIGSVENIVDRETLLSGVGAGILDGDICKLLPGLSLESLLQAQQIRLSRQILAALHIEK
jgi:hypothetical protein